MKRFCSVFLLFALLLTGFSSAAAAEAPLVVDNANLLSQGEQQDLEQTAQKLSEEYNMDVVILTALSLEGKNAETYADDYYDDNGYGTGAQRSGILLLISMEDRDWAISTCGQALRIITDGDLELLEEAMLSDLSQGRYYAGFRNYLNTLDRILTVPNNASSKTGGFTFSKFLAIFLRSLLIGLVVAGIVLLILRRQMNTAKPQKTAETYVVPGSFQLTQQRDIYLYSNTTRIKRQTTQNNAGDVHRGGTSSHHSSSGTSHGGSHGKF